MKKILSIVVLLLSLNTFSQKFTGNSVMTTFSNGTGNRSYASGFKIELDNVNKKITIQASTNNSFLIEITSNTKYELGMLYDGLVTIDNVKNKCVVLINDNNIAVYASGNSYYYFHCGSKYEWHKIK